MEGVDDVGATLGEEEGINVGEEKGKEKRENVGDEEEVKVRAEGWKKEKMLVMWYIQQL